MLIKNEFMCEIQTSNMIKRAIKPKIQAKNGLSIFKFAKNKEERK